MKRAILGKTGLEVSYLGLGTSAAYDGVLCTAKMKLDDYPELLCFGYDLGVTFWDTSITYRTHSAIKDALKTVSRKDVVICSKTAAASSKSAGQDVERAMREIGTDYIDIFLMQCIRSKLEFRYKSSALNILIKMKKKGYIRAIGLASHGIGALECAKDSDEIDIVLGRINYSGYLMDQRAENFRSAIAGIPIIKKISRKVLPGRVFKTLASSVQDVKVEEKDHQASIRLFQALHALGKPVIGMKILGEGYLANDVPRAIQYVTSLPFISSVVLGCCSKEELIQLIDAVNHSLH